MHIGSHAFQDLMAIFLSSGAFPSSEELLQRWLTLASDESETALVLGLEELSRTLEHPEEAVRDGVKFLQRRLLRAAYERSKEEYRQALLRGDSEAARQLETRLAEVARQLASP